MQFFKIVLLLLYLGTHYFDRIAFQDEMNAEYHKDDDEFTFSARQAQTFMELNQVLVVELPPPTHYAQRPVINYFF